MTGGRPAVFLDRDGTLIPFRQYPSSPEDMALVPDIGPPLRALQARGMALVVVTNQSGLAHGYFTEDDLARAHDRLHANLAAQAIVLDAVYHCPHHVEGVVPGLAIECACRKPRPALLLRAADELRLDLSRSWMVGDTVADADAGSRAGCRTMAVSTTRPPWPSTAWALTTAAALAFIDKDSPD